MKFSEKSRVGLYPCCGLSHWFGGPSYSWTMKNVKEIETF